MGRALAHNPQPLIDPDRRIIVLFSPKSACSNVLIWFLHHLGQAQAAREYHRWPHRYRINIYYRSPLYRRGCRSNLRDFRVIRVVRDPYQRSASSFRHVLGLPKLSANVARVLRRPVDSEFSFATFLDYLEATDLTTCNPHYAIQRHPIEDFLPVDHLVNISREDLFTRLNEIEADLGLPRSDLAGNSWVKALARRHHRSNKRLSGDQYGRVLTRAQARKGPWPDYALLLTPEAKARIARLYGTDFKAYGIEP